MSIAEGHLLLSRASSEGGLKRPDVVNMLQTPAAVTRSRLKKRVSHPPTPAELQAHPHREEPRLPRPDLAWPPCPDERQSNVPGTP